MKLSPIHAAIEKATSETLLRADPNYNAVVITLINSRPDIPKEAILHFKKRLIARNPKIQILAIDLLESTVNATSLTFHTQVASKDFLSTLSQIYRGKDSDSEVKQKIKELLTSWYRRFADSTDILPGFQEIYIQLKLGGEIQQRVEARPQAFQVENRVVEENKSLPVEKAEKLKKDLQVVVENVSLTNDIMDAGETAENETLMELVNTLKAMEGKLLKLLERLEDLQMLDYCLGIKDNLQETLNKYQDLKKGIRSTPKTIKKPEPVDLLFDMHEEPKVSESKIIGLSDLLFDAPQVNILPSNYVNPFFTVPEPNREITPQPGPVMYRENLNYGQPPLIQQKINPIQQNLDPFGSLVIGQNPPQTLPYSNPSSFVPPPQNPNTYYQNYSNVPQYPSLHPQQFMPNPINNQRKLDFKLDESIPQNSYPSLGGSERKINEKKENFDELFDFKF